MPLVRDGSMNLKIVATRKEGFTAPIGVQMLYNPPGVGQFRLDCDCRGTNRSLDSADGQQRRGDCKWKIVVLGDSAVGDAFDYHGFANGDAGSCRAVRGIRVPGRGHRKGPGHGRGDQGGKEASDFEGAAKVEMFGLPNEVTTEPQEITKDSTELVFHVKTTANSPAGKHKTVICRATIMANGEPITHTLGTGELRIDEPLPAKPRRKRHRCRRPPRHRLPANAGCPRND